MTGIVRTVQEVRVLAIPYEMAPKEEYTGQEAESNMLQKKPCSFAREQQGDKGVAQSCGYSYAIGLENNRRTEFIKRENGGLAPVFLFRVRIGTRHTRIGTRFLL